MTKVIILGGGVAGMSAAHELIERDFEVEVYEKKPLYVGGKARSVDVPNTNNLYPDKYLPGEHGFRFFPGFYKHIIDTMERIKFIEKGIEKNVKENLVAVTREQIARFKKTPIIFPVNFPKNLNDLKAFLSVLHADTGLSDEEKETFEKKLWQIATSCKERRLHEYEKLNWWDYMEAERFSQTYRNLCVGGMTQTLVAADPHMASVRTNGDIILQIIFNIANPSVNTDRLLNGPTNDKWLTPWYKYLTENNKVEYTKGAELKEIKVQDGKISMATVLIDEKEVKEIKGDYYILAVPVEQAAIFMSKEVTDLDPKLKGIIKIKDYVSWMNGIMFYLSEPIDVVKGHCTYADSPWALTSISQLPVWGNYDIQERGHGNVKAILSVDISNWNEKGLIYHKKDISDKVDKGVRKKARDCTKKEIKEEVWMQLKKSLNVEGNEVLRDDQLVHWYLDSDIHPDGIPGREIDDEPLLVNRANSWKFRPEASSLIPNFFLASDYVRTYTDLATMEGANEAARRAVNGIIDHSGSDAKHCELWDLHEPNILAGLRKRDKKRFDKGLPYKLLSPWWLVLIESIAKFLKKLIGG